MRKLTLTIQGNHYLSLLPVYITNYLYFGFTVAEIYKCINVYHTVSLSVNIQYLIN